MKALIIATNKFEDSELFYPYYRLKEAEIEVDVASPKGQTISGKHGIEIESDLKIGNAVVEDYELLVIPGGRSPEHLRLEAPEVIELVKKFDASDKLIAAICHGAQLLISANILENRKATCYWSIRDDLENAGAEFVDQSVVVDENIITARHPPDNPDFMRKVLGKLKD
ncbi:hypothetical protein AKJ50_01915 [candidate division MSBL1 archaeon SCGC-AAA382A13]|uniref:DJ-1/PfpI domain-containing protein n=1 Tax=candidate division MSBL1 archaeon SCGC-AAA382A13 TaxID=1698279 RepID=A0A133VEN6_9EURY|nr:hypothetical protein AKJ50_01915 [candidate division MSBL1 archaeon SCGC-AAA382A13]